MNPVLARELTERMRGRRAAVLLTLYLALLGTILSLFYAAEAGPTRPFEEPLATRAAEVGRGVFGWLVLFMLLLVLFLVPALTSGAIAGERERQTLVPLQITLLSPASILLGKVAASLAFLGLLLVATLPLLAVAYLIGGVSIGDVLAALGAVLVVGVVLACLSASISTFVRRVQPATVLSYGVTLVLVLGTVLAYGALIALERAGRIDPPGIGSRAEWLLLANPVVAVGDALGRDPDEGRGSDSPLDALRQLANEDRFREQATAVQSIDSGGTVSIGGFDGVRDDGGTAFWLRSYGLQLLLAIGALALAARRLRTPARTER